MRMTSIKLIRTIAQNEHAPNLFSEKDTHEDGLKTVCGLAEFTNDEALISDIIRGYLPEDYSGNTIDEVPEMLEWARENPGSEKPEKHNVITLLLGYFANNGVILFNNEEEVGCIKVPNSNGGSDATPLRSKRGKLVIRKILHKELQTILRGNDLSDLINTLESIAIFDGEFHEFRLRVAREKSSILVDIGDQERSVIVCNKDGWKITKTTTTMFRRREGYRALPIPVSGGDIDKLRELLSIEDDHVWHCLLAFIVNVFRPNGPYYCLIVDGEQGSGKSFLSTVIKRLVDANLVEKLRFPRSDRDLMIQATQFYLIVFDNASGIKQSLSNSLCTIATGGGFATRTLHTDDDLKIFNVCRPFIINGIGGFAHNPDLLERGIHLTLPSMERDKVKTEEELNKLLHEILPSILGVFMDAIVEAMKNIDTTPTPKGLRMADAARWIAAAEPVFNLPKDTLINALRKSQDETMAASVIETALAQGIIKVLNRHNGKFRGGCADLLGELDVVGANLSKDPFFPKTSSKLSKELKKFAPALKKAGIDINRLPRANTGSRLEIRYNGLVDYSVGEIDNVNF